MNIRREEKGCSIRSKPDESMKIRREEKGCSIRSKPENQRRFSKRGERLFDTKQARESAKILEERRKAVRYEASQRISEDSRREEKGCSIRSKPENQ
ncbi:hypothetical protein HYFRA_00011491 [Hymenoscyphus fraxineus]|uniref:Uncharacterized protein n=1 Tax=Hymenoscyphus fraxineus TaxID=746836 RepID=A0A9N9L6J2_9HELO|nr:hypothetical protein HYFRA_00011491 [Hymenoscyphus fraxineus]